MAPWRPALLSLVDTAFRARHPLALLATSATPSQSCAVLAASPNGMDGMQVADAGKARQPGYEVLFTTGFAKYAVLGEGDVETDIHGLVMPSPV